MSSSNPANGERTRRRRLRTNPESEPPSDALVFAPDDASGALDPSLALAFERAARRVGRAGRARKDVVFSLDRGIRQGDISRGASFEKSPSAPLRAAAPKQIARRRRAGAPPASRRVHITKDDLRNKRMSRRAGSLTVFLVDASGSMALHRMAAAKSAALRLVAESHTKRDSVALVSIAGDAATVLLPPTRSILAANRRLAELPCGAVRPLAHGLVVVAGESRGQRREDEGRSERRARGAHHRRRRERRSRSVASNVERAVSSGGVRPLEGGAAGRGGGRGEAFGTRARGSAFGGGHGEVRSRVASGWTRRGRTSRRTSRARRAGSITGCRWSRTRARAGGALVVSVGLSARAPFSPLTDCRTPPEPVSRRFTPRVPADARARVGSPSRDPRRNGAF